MTVVPTAVTIKSYKRSDFALGYPQDWKDATSGNEVAFTDPTGNYNLTIGSTSNPNGNVTADQLAAGGGTGAKTNLKNAQDITVPKTTTIGRVEGSQARPHGTSHTNGPVADVEGSCVAPTTPHKDQKTQSH